MVLAMEESSTPDRDYDPNYIDDMTYGLYDGYLAREAGAHPYDNRDPSIYEPHYSPACRSLCGFNPPVPTHDGNAISRGEFSDEIEEFDVQLWALKSLIDAAWRTVPGNDNPLLREHPQALRHMLDGWVEFHLPRYDSPAVRLQPGEGYDFLRNRKIPAHSPRPDRAAFVPYTEVKALLAKRKETDDAG